MGCNCGNNAVTYTQAATGRKPSGPNITNNTAPSTSNVTNITGGAAPSRPTGAQNITGRGTGGGFRVPAYAQSSRSTVRHTR